MGKSKRKRPPKKREKKAIRALQQERKDVKEIIIKMRQFRESQTHDIEERERRWVGWGITKMAERQR